MSTQAQLDANRTNAQKSTGPRTPQGKTITAQNAVKHGLLAQRFIVAEQDRQAFEDFRGKMTAELAPHGQLESVFADRIATLSWRLSRIDSIQISVLNILADEMTEELKAVGESYIKQEMKPPTISFNSLQAKEEYILGRTIIKDFIGQKVLEKLSAYERRIQRDLLTTRKELYLLQNLRKQTDAETAAAKTDNAKEKALPLQRASTAKRGGGIEQEKFDLLTPDSSLLTPVSKFLQTNPIPQKSSTINEIGGSPNKPNLNPKSLSMRY